MRYDEVLLEFIENCKVAGKSPLKNFKKMENHDEVLKYLISIYGENNTVSEMLYSFINNLDTIPLAACGLRCKFEGLRIRHMCINYKVNDENSCKLCYEYQKCLILQNRRNSVQEKYGVDSVSKVKSIRDKAIETTIKKYGVDNISKLESVKNVKLIKHTKSSSTSSYLYNKLLTPMKNRCLSIQQFIESNNKYTMKYISFLRKNEIIFECNKCNNNFSIFNYKSTKTISCPKCEKKSISTQELELRDFVSSIVSDEILYNKRILGSKEIDILIPSLSIGIEFNGIYWHSERVRDKNYHQDKCKLAKERGINLIQIFEDEWSTNKDKIKKRLMYLLHNEKTSIYARKCTVLEIDSKTASGFCKEHHLNGYANSKINIGLFYNEVLVSVMTFGKSRYNKKYEYELVRYCSSGNVIGAFGKILKYFECNYNPKSLLSYADFDWSNGEIYLKNNFTFKGYTKPGYFYSIYRKNTFKRYSRYECQKHKLMAKYDWVTDDMTEEYICCEMLKYNKLYNSGNIIFVKEY